jgi:FkbM family methyltransferase
MHKLIRWIERGSQLGLRSLLPGPQEARVLARRQIALFFLRHFRKEMTFRRNGFTWTGSPFCLVSESIFLSGHYQDAFIELLLKYLNAERTVIVNIGAHIGDVALPFSRTGKRVVAIEPNPKTFARLQKNVRQNNLDARIDCLQFAISDKEGLAQLVVYPDAASSELLGDESRVGYGLGVQSIQVQVKTVRLDGLLKSRGITPDQVALVWSDTQGLEAQVIESAPDLWRNGTLLWVEIWPRGLDCHGGADHFVELCKRHFRSLLRADQMKCDPEPIDNVESIVRSLKFGEHTDALLIP